MAKKGPHHTWIRCPKSGGCNGSGWQGKNPCGTCGGRGGYYICNDCRGIVHGQSCNCPPDP